MENINNMDQVKIFVKKTFISLFEFTSPKERGKGFSFRTIVSCSISYIPGFI